MKFMRLKIAAVPLATILFFAACSNGGTKESSARNNSSDTTGQSTQSREAKLYLETLHIHDEVMKEMGKLKGYEKRVQQQSDSIKTMLATTDFTVPMARRIAGDLDSLDQLGKNLQAADSAMFAWMGQFDPDPQLASTEANADYFEKQKVKAEAMKAIFFNAMRDAENRFKNKK